MAKLNLMIRINKILDCRFIFILICISGPSLMKSQNLNSINNRIDSCFEKLDKEEFVNSMKICSTKEFLPFYQSFYYKNFLEEQRVKSGAICVELLPSCNMMTLQNINAILNGDEDALYSLVDSSEIKIFDLVRINCGGKTDIGRISKVNEEKIKDIFFSYNKWHKQYRKIDYLNIYRQGKSPIMFSNFKWIKELGYISELKSNNELIKLFEIILNDSTYCNYFVKKHKLKLFSSKSNNEREILSELMLLTLFNNSNPFTTDIRKFNLTYGLPNIGQTFFQIMQKLFACNEKNNNLCEIEDFFDKHGLIVRLSP